MPRPKKHVFVCTQNRQPGHPRGSCQQNNCSEVVDEFMLEFQSRDLHVNYALTFTGCIGPCGSGPSVLVYPEGVMYGKVTRQDVKAIIDEHLLGDQPVERLKVPAEIW
ncbi:MAG: (2Fe-2S) ferredoxin domain-containing protein [Sulfuricellaceae bacterium]